MNRLHNVLAAVQLYVSFLPASVPTRRHSGERGAITARSFSLCKSYPFGLIVQLACVTHSPCRLFTHGHTHIHTNLDAGIESTI